MDTTGDTGQGRETPETLGGSTVPTGVDEETLPTRQDYFTSLVRSILEGFRTSISVPVPGDGCLYHQSFRV